MKEDAELYQHTYSKIYNTENLHRSEDGNSLIDKLQTKDTKFLTMGKIKI